VALSKAINNSETPVKEKHARNAILGTFEDNGGAMFWNIASKMPVQANPIVCWKFLQLVHKLMRDGHPNVVKDSVKYGSQIKDLGKLWGHLKEGYGKLIAGYCRLLIQKLKFHRKFPHIPGNLSMTDEQYYKICGDDVNNYFEFSIDMLDYMDEILALQHAVFGSLDMSRANSMTTSGQCRLAPLILCILDSCQLYDYLVKSLFHLHSSLNPDTLNGHRDRFLLCYKKLKDFYYKCSNLQYFKHLVQVPSLPENPPNFLTASDFTKHIKPVAVVKEEPEVEVSETDSVDNLIDTAEADPFQVSKPPEPDERDFLIERLQREIHLLKEELGRVRAEDHRVISGLKEEISRLEKILSELRLSANKSLKENEDLKKDVDQLKADAVMATKLPEAEKNAKANQEKFQKMKDIYGKLREEHVALLRNHDTLNKQLNTEKKTLEEKEEVIKESELELSRMRQEKQLVAENLQKSADDVAQQLAEAASFNSKLETQKAGLEERLQSMEESKQTLEQDLESRAAQITSLTSDLREARDQATEREQDLTEELEKLRSQLSRAESEKESTESRLSERLDQANTQLSETQAQRDQVTSDLSSQVTQLTDRCHQLENDITSQWEKLMGEKEESEQKLQQELDQLRQMLIDRSISEATAMLEDALEQQENPAFVSSTCTAEYLIWKASPVLPCVQRLQDASTAYSADKHVLHEVVSAITAFSHQMSDCVVQGFATSHAAQIEPGEELSSACRNCGQQGLSLLSTIKQDTGVEQASTSVSQSVEVLLKLAEALVPKMEDVNAEEIGDMLETEMAGMTSAIEDAASKIQDMLHKTREDSTGVNLEVHENILGSCTDLMKAVKVLVEKSRDLQKEIVSSGRGTASAKEFYKKNNRWSEGLLSAAKAVGWGATTLLEVADRVVSGQGKFEEIMAVAKEIAASTAQLVVSSKVKAERGSVKLSELSSASKCVNQATGKVVASAKSAAEVVEDQNLYDYSHLTLHQTKQMEMNTQIKVMEFETLLERERKKLGEMRKHHYTLVGDSDQEEDVVDSVKPAEPSASEGKM